MSRENAAQEHLLDRIRLADKLRQAAAGEEFERRRELTQMAHEASLREELEKIFGRRELEGFKAEKRTERDVTRHQQRLEEGAEDAAAALERVRLQQEGADRRAASAEAGRDRRFEAGEAGKDRRAKRDEGGFPSFKSFNREIEARVTEAFGALEGNQEEAIKAVIRKLLGDRAPMREILRDAEGNLRGLPEIYELLLAEHRARVPGTG